MITLPRTSLQIFPLGLGTNTFRDPSNPTPYETILDAFIDGGGNFIDTADQYTFWVPGNRGGEAETVLGEWMRKRKNRDRVVLATKVGGLPAREGLAPATIRAAVDESLRRLQTDTIDLYYAHFDDDTQPIEGIAASFDALVQAGKVRYIAVSNVEPERIEAWIRVARDENLAVPVALQPNYSLVNRANYEQRLAPLAARHDLSVFPYFALASGFLTGKYRSPADAEGATRGGAVSAYLNPEGLAVIDALQTIAQDRGAAFATVALAWILAKPTVTAPLASATTTAQLQELLAAPGLKLDAGEVAALDRASASFAGAVGA